VFVRLLHLEKIGLIREVTSAGKYEGCAGGELHQDRPRILDAHEEGG
jgi:hypothetical protein